MPGWTNLFGEFDAPAGLFLLAYLVGSVPTAQLVARAFGRKDLRSVGSRTVSATGVYYHVSPWLFWPVAAVDILKVAFVTWLGLGLGAGRGVAAAAGLTAVVGHCWPVWLGFRGGRGVTGFLGLWLVLFPPGALWLLAGLVLGRLGLLIQTAAGTLVALATWPLVLTVLGLAPDLVLTAWACLGLTVLKRLEANRLGLPADPAARRRVLLNRLLWDRDVGPREPWVQR